MQNYGIGLYKLLQLAVTNHKEHAVSLTNHYTWSSLILPRLAVIGWSYLECVLIPAICLWLVLKQPLEKQLQKLEFSLTKYQLK